jgi:multiple sugar transport system permease protein
MACGPDGGDLTWRSRYRRPTQAHLAATQQDGGDADPVPVAGLLFFGLYVIIPIFQSFNISLYRWDGLGEATYIGLAQLRRASDRPEFRDLAVEQRQVAGAVPAGDPDGPGIALFLNQTVAGIRIYKSMFFFPFVLSQVVVGLVFSWFYLPREGL